MLKYGTLFLGLMMPLFCVAYAPFSVVSPNYQTDQKSQITFNKIPPFYSQDGLGNCFSATTAAYVDMLNCKAENENPNVNNCQNLNPADTLSRLATGKFAGSKKGATKEEDYSGLLPTDGANPITNLENIIYDKICPPSQACASLDKSLTNFSDSGKYAEAKAAIFDQLKQKHQSITKGCIDCTVTMTARDEEEIKSLTNQLELKNNVNVLQAFTNSSYSQFLEKILMPNKCNQKSSEWRCYDGPENVKVEAFPINNEKPGKEALNKTIVKIKDILKKDTPVILNNICTKPSGKCETKDPALHTLIITGYRKVCGPTGCKDSLRVYNSWGTSWQQQHADGWLDADSLLDSTSYKAGILTWVQDTGNKATASL
jgi:hypothetical protein